MNDDNSFVERPTGVLREKRAVHDLTERLIATAENGKAIPWPRASVGTSRVLSLLRRGLKVRVSKTSAGTYLAWCERIEAPKP